MAAQTIDLRGVTLAELEQFFQDHQMPSYRAGQVFQWVQQKGAGHWDELKNIGVRAKLLLAENFSLQPPRIIDVKNQDGHTVKFLLELADEERVETVLMSYRGRQQRERHTVCLSSQAGCPMACSFCATGKEGFRRQLTAAEIVLQAHAAQQFLQARGEKVTNLVFMGMGEPLLNFNPVWRALEIMHHPAGMDIGYRKVTISTCGLVPGIKKLADQELPIGLAVSLHAPNNTLRDTLVPINRQYPLAELLKACDYYIEKTGRRVTFEYTLIRDVNDNLQQARELASLLEGRLANVNLIPLNYVTDLPYRPSSRETIKAFQNQLNRHGIVTVVRESRGQSIDAACGQLRRSQGS